MATVILVRHGRTTANATGILAGRTEGVLLDETGRRQAAATGERLAGIPLAGVVSSPLERCRETSEFILALQNQQGGEERPLELDLEDDLTECDYGQWQGRGLKGLSKEKLWATVQSHPSAVVFPGGESMAGMQARSVASVRAHDAAFEEVYGLGAVWVAVSHGDIIKSVLADAFGMHLDLFQRITVGPASVSIIRYGEGRPSVYAMNTDAGDLSWLAASAPTADATVGGGAGHPTPTTSPA